MVLVVDSRLNALVKTHRSEGRLQARSGLGRLRPSKTAPLSSKSSHQEVASFHMGFDML